MDPASLVLLLHQSDGHKEDPKTLQYAYINREKKKGKKKEKKKRCEFYILMIRKVDNYFSTRKSRFTIVQAEHVCDN